MPRTAKKKATANTEAAAPAKITPESSNMTFVTVKLDLLSGKVTVTPAQTISINNEVANLMMYYNKGNRGQASYKLTIEGMSVGNIIDESADKFATYKAPITYWETLIQVADLISNINSTISTMLGRKTTWWKEKKIVSIVRNVKADAS